MSNEEALQLIVQACNSVLANLETHQRLQEALQIITRVVEKSPNYSAGSKAKPDK